MGVRTTEGLKTIMDADDAFISGHQIKKIRRQKRSTPEWARHQKQVRELLLRSFPKLNTSQKQRKRAGRWMRIIHLYFVLGFTCSQVAAELGEEIAPVKRSIEHIRNASKGKRADGSGTYKRKR